MGSFLFSNLNYNLSSCAQPSDFSLCSRGLTPRLAMYMSQGAIFFASYEFFKSMFSLEILHIPAQVIEKKEDTKDDAVVAA